MSLPSDAAAGRSVDARLRPAAEWVGETPPREGLPVYLEVLRARAWLIVYLVALGVGAAALYVSGAEKVYEADADILVTPVSRDIQTLVGLGLVSESGDPTRDVETVAQLITTPAVAQRVRTRLRLEPGPRSLLKQVSAQPVAQSSIITVTAKANNPQLAADIANAFAEGAIAERTVRLHRLLDALVPRLRRQLGELPAGEEAAKDALTAKLQDLQTLRVLPDPTLHFETRAVPARDAVAPRPVLSIAAAFLASLVLGIGVVVGAHVLDTRIRREEELRRYRLPVLARIPLQRRKPFAARSAVLPNELAPSTRDAFRRLASSLSGRTDRANGRSVFVTGASPSEGKTTSAINLAAALAEMNEQVILIEGDSRRPSLIGELGLRRDAGITDVSTGRTRLRDALEQTEGLPSGVRVLPQERESAAAPVQLSVDAADAILAEAEAQADWVIVDGPALNYAPDALPLAKRARSVILLIRLGKTRTRDLQELAELLVQQGITPDGFVLVGTRPYTAYY
jgi:tyrosine-protein kinase